VKSAEEVSAQRLVSLFQKKFGIRVLSLAYHAALPVVITPELLHLIRINFFFEPNVSLPYDAEIDLLFSDLCQEADKKYGLYEFDHTVRELLLKGLQVTYGTERIREVAALLYQYSEKNSPWIQRVELERAQQITALNFLSPEKAQEWLQMAEEVKQANSGEMNEKWFIAVRKKLISVESLVAGDAQSQLLQDVRVKLIEGVKKRWIDNPIYSNSQDDNNWQISKASSRDPQSSRMAASDAFSLLQGMAVILGEPGIGKTFALIHVAKEELKRRTQSTSNRIPVILRLNGFPSTATNLQEWLVSEISVQYQVPLAIVDGLIRAHELTFLLDGLDEARTPANCVIAINEFLKTNGGVRVAVTCRTLIYSQLPPLNLNGEILPADQFARAATRKRVEKTVFISYRRTNMPWALAIYQNLTVHGFDVFFDYQSIASGDFERTILENIRSRAHFLVLLTPSALERCADPNDWLRREIETAIDETRNIIPIFLEDFHFGSPSISKYLTGKLAYLKNYNGQTIPAGYFDEAMEKLRSKFLNIGVSTVLHPVSTAVQKEVQKQQVAASKATSVKEKELTAQEWFERGYKSDDLDEKINCFSEAIRLKPDYAEAYYYRGEVSNEKNEYDSAIKDFSEAIYIKPDYADAYANRGKAHAKAGRDESSLADYEKALELNPANAVAYSKDLAEIRRKFNGKNVSATVSPIILVAENDREYRRTLRKLLESNGYKVIEASSVEMALEMLRANAVDIALVDLRLTDDTDADDTSGLDVAQVASQMNKSCIIMTSYPTMEIARHALRNEQGKSLAQDLVVKQDGPLALLDSIKNLLSKLDSEATKPKSGNRGDLNEISSNEFDSNSNISRLPNQEWLKHYEGINKRLGSLRSESVFDRWSYYWTAISDMEEFFDTADMLSITRAIIDVFQKNILSIINGIRNDNRDNPTEVGIIVMSTDQLLESLRQVRDGLSVCSRLFEKDDLNPDNRKMFLNTTRQIGNQLSRAKNTFTFKTSFNTINNLDTKSEFQLRKHSIGSIIRETQRRFQSVAANRDLEIRVSIRGDEEQQLEISPDHIQMALNNIVYNAIKYSYGGNSQQTRFIEIRGFPEMDRYAIQVSNYGIGIGEDEIKKRLIFEPFYRGRNTQKANRAGSGIGLAYVRQVVEDLHHGSIDVEDRPLSEIPPQKDSPHLTTFTLRLPYSQSN